MGPYREARRAMPNEAVGNPVTVLIVDDDDQMRAVIRGFLEREGYRVLERGSADDALLMLDAIRPDVIILDRMMPGTSGIDFLSRLRRRDRTVPVILITAFGGPDVEADALRRGAASYLEKPFRMGKVVQAVRRLTRAGRDEDSSPDELE
jgi:two-component system phosphate regulon response regulator OmpR